MFILSLPTWEVSVGQLHLPVGPPWKIVEGPQVAVQCEWTHWWLKAEGVKWQSVPFFELPEKVPCSPGEWTAAAGRAVTWPQTPGPGQQGDYGRNSSHQGDLVRNGRASLNFNISYDSSTIIPTGWIITKSYSISFSKNRNRLAHKVKLPASFKWHYWHWLWHNARLLSVQCCNINKVYERLNLPLRGNMSQYKDMTLNLPN